jgi:hypothetical protein
MTLASARIVGPSSLWWRPEDGDGFTLGRQDPGGAVLMPRPGTARVQYDVIEGETGLFKNFAETDGTPMGFVEFANRYGAMFIGCEGPGPAMEPISFWSSARAWMRHLVSLRDALQAQDRAAVEAVIQWRDGRIEAVGPTRKDLGEIAPGPLPYSINAAAEAWRTGDRSSPAVDYLVQQINREMFRVNKICLGVSPRHPHRASLFAESTSLWGAMVFQLFAMVLEGKTFKRCAVCDKWFEAGGQIRSDKLTCSGACRTRLTRQRKKGETE